MTHLKKEKTIISFFGLGVVQ
jgi:hypothetical protein